LYENYKKKTVKIDIKKSTKSETKNNNDASNIVIIDENKSNNEILSDLGSLVEECFSSSDEENNKSDESDDVMKDFNSSDDPDTNSNDNKQKKIKFAVEPSQTTNNSQEKLNSKIRFIMQRRFHSLNKQFSLIDTKKQEKIDKQILKQILEGINFKITNSDLNLLWSQIAANEDDKILFSNFVHRFSVPNSSLPINKLRKMINKKNKNEELSNTDNNYPKKNEQEVTKNDSISSQNDDSSKYSLKNKFHSSIVSNWNNIKNDFQASDKMNQAHLSNGIVLNILKKYTTQSSDDELIKLMKYFSSNDECSEMDYVKFLNDFSSNFTATLISTIKEKETPIVTTTHSNKVIEKIIKKLRQIYTNNNESISKQNPLLIDIKNIRKAFTKFDSKRKGYLVLSEFKQLLAFCNLNVNVDQMYSILSLYDPELRGAFYYELLIRDLIERSISN
jgi:Ca2+-binding EF-hand superfamily protein